MTSIETRPEVHDVGAFVAAVRQRLTDLSDEQRDELLDGLEADLAEQMADGGPLPDPAAYADELRAAAGLPSPSKRRLLTTPSGDWAVRGLDRLRSWWLTAMGRRLITREAWSVVATLRPLWWVLRAWLAVTLVDHLASAIGGEPVAIWPRLAMPLGFVLLPAAVVLSVLIGQGRLWPGSGPERRTRSRLVLAGLNTVGVLALIAVANHGAVFGYGPVDTYGQAYWGAYDRGYREAASAQAGVRIDGRRVHNLYVYDVQGQPLSGVQLFDGAGRPVALTPDQATSGGGGGSATRVVGCPWVNGTTTLYNVFPLPERPQPFRTCRTARSPDLAVPVLPVPPLAQVPPVALPTTP